MRYREFVQILQAFSGLIWKRLQCTVGVLTSYGPSKTGQIILPFSVPDISFFFPYVHYFFFLLLMFFHFHFSALSLLAKYKAAIWSDTKKSMLSQWLVISSSGLGWLIPFYVLFFSLSTDSYVQWATEGKIDIENRF